MEGNIIDLLNSPMDIGVLVIVVAAWFVIWHVALKRGLRKCDVISIWYELYELGAFGTLAILIFLSLIAILFIGSIQAAIEYGIKLLFPLLLFWGGFVAFTILIIRAIRKKK